MSNPKKIVHIITGLNIGGAEQMLKRLLLSDPDVKEKVVIISLSGIGTIGEHLKTLGYQIEAFDFHKYSSIPANFLALVKLLKKTKPDIVQTWMYHADFFGGIAARFAGCRNVIWGIRNTSVPINSKMTYWLMRLCALLSRAIPKKIVCVAEAAKKKHIAYGYKAKKMLVISNGFDFDYFDPLKVDKKHLRNELGLGADDFLLGCLGRWHPDKGQDLFINAVAYLDKLQNKKMHFVLIGRDCDNNNAELLQQLEFFGLTSSFILLGERHDIPTCLAALDVFCMPSRTEGFPNGLGEAMTMGLPCIATNVGDTKVLAGDTAVIIAPDDPMALAAGLTKIICMPAEQRQQLGEQASNRVHNLFSINTARERFYALYQEMLGA